MNIFNIMNGIKFLKKDGFVEIDGYTKNQVHLEYMGFVYIKDDNEKLIKVCESMYVHINKREKQLTVGYVKDFSKSRAETIISKFGIKKDDCRIETEKNYIYYNFKKK